MGNEFICWGFIGFFKFYLPAVMFSLMFWHHLPVVKGTVICLLGSYVLHELIVSYGYNKDQTWTNLLWYQQVCAWSLIITLSSVCLYVLTLIILGFKETSKLFLSTFINILNVSGSYFKIVVLILKRTFGVYLELHCGSCYCCYCLFETSYFHLVIFYW